MSRALTAVLAAAMALAGLVGCTSPAPSARTSTSPGTGPPAPSGSAIAAGASRLSWHPCPQVSVGAAPTTGRLQCASLQVPLNYADPAGRKITLALSEVAATAPPAKQQGVLLVNPGGPGGSGLSFAQEVASGLAPQVAKQYDIVGFDTRGVGASRPALSCDPAFFSRPRPDYVPANAAAEQVLVNRAKQYAADCKKRYGWLLPYMTTEDLARDMDSIRVALGQRQINYYGVSYGTYLGQVYATLFPHQVRRMVLDSVVDPNGVWFADNIQQDYAFQGRMTAFFSWIARYDSTYHLGKTEAEVNSAFNAAMRRLEAHPISGSSGPLIGPDELNDTFLVGGYSNSWWPYLAAALSSYVGRGSGTELIPLYQQIGKQGENEFAVYNAVECSDAGWPRSWAYWNSDTRKVYAKAPYETWGNTWFNASCAFWPVKGPAKALHIHTAGLAPILMLQGTKDGATPYAGALAARKVLPSARLVVVQGGGNHGQSLTYPPNDCVNGYLDRYLADGSLPGRSGLVNATCPALAPPAAVTP